MKKILGLVMVLGVFGVILGGCSKSEEGATAPADGAAAPAAGAPAPAAGDAAK